MDNYGVFLKAVPPASKLPHDSSDLIPFDVYLIYLTF